MRIAIVAAIAALVASVILLRGLDERLKRTPVLSPTKIDAKKIRTLMKYHGTLVVVIERGEPVPHRGGRKCRLWDPEECKKNGGPSPSRMACRIKKTRIN